METSRIGPGRLSRRTVLITASVAGLAVWVLSIGIGRRGPTRPMPHALPAPPCRSASPPPPARTCRSISPGSARCRRCSPSASTPRSTASCKRCSSRKASASSRGDVLAKIDPRLYQAALDAAKAHKAQDEAALVAAVEGPRPVPGAGAQERRNPAERRSAAGQGRSDQGLDRRRRRGHRDRADQPRLHQYRGDQRRPHGRAHGRSRATSSMPATRARSRSSRRPSRPP